MGPKAAAQLGVDLNTLSGSGPDGLRQADVLAASGAGAVLVVVLHSLTPHPRCIGLRGPRKWPGHEPDRSCDGSPDASLAMPTFRVMVRARFDQLKRAAKTSGVSTTVAIARACALAIAKHPKINSAWQLGDRILDRTQVDVGIAVAAEGGLVVPVLRSGSPAHSPS